MAYRADFYIRENIIGWTGNLFDNPTVYFIRNLDDGTMEFGHITQDHPSPGNIGRGGVNRCAQGAYTIGNYLFETEDGALFWASEEEAPSVDYYHMSRNTFAEVDELNPAQRTLLTLSIYNHKRLKPKYAEKGLKYMHKLFVTA
jgi:hypothetical protein